MLASEKIRKVFRYIGYNEDKPGIRVFPIIINIMSTSLCVNIFFYIARNASETDDASQIRIVIAAKDVVFILINVGCTLDYVIGRKKMQTLLRIIDKTFSKYNDEFRETQRRFIDSSKQYQLDTLHYTGVLLFIGCLIMTILPGVVAVLLLLKEGTQETVIKGLPLPVAFLYPKHYVTIPMYIIIYIYQTVYLTHILALAFCGYASISNAFQSIIIDIKLFCLDLNDVNDVLVGYEDTYSIKLRHYANYLITCHQNILSSMTTLKQCVSWILTLSNQFMCFNICVYLYCATTVDNLFIKIGCCIFASSISVLFLTYCHHGQTFINASEDVRVSLYECSWVNKPQWFKKDLQFMMTMANMPLKIEPYGLYVLNLHTFVNIMNAAYTYFNVLRTLKN